MRRRTLLVLPMAGLVPALVSACSEESAVPTSDPSTPSTPTATATPTAAGGERIAYGRDPSQFVELHRPDGGVSRGVVVVIHGGFW